MTVEQVQDYVNKWIKDLSWQEDEKESVNVLKTLIKALEENEELKAELKDCRKVLRESGCEIDELKKENELLKEEINSMYDYKCGLKEENVSNSKESFKVGDYVKVVMGVNKGIQGTIKEFNFFNNKVLLDNHYHVLLKEIEHAEPQNEEQKKPCFDDYDNGCDVCSYAKKHEYEYPCCDCTHGRGTNEHFTTEEPNFEWAWGCNYADDTKTRFWAKSEEEAISWCENYMLEVGCDTTYRKVCRKK